jgi:hypothetical protein
VAEVVEHQRAGPDRADRVGVPWPAMSGAEPWIGSNIDGWVRVGLMFAPGAMRAAGDRGADVGQDVAE